MGDATAQDGKKSIQRNAKPASLGSIADGDEKNKQNKILEERANIFQTDLYENNNL